MESYKAYFQSKYKQNTDTRNSKKRNKFSFSKNKYKLKISQNSIKKQKQRIVMVGIPMFFLICTMIIFLNPIFEEPEKTKTILQISKLENVVDHSSSQIMDSESTNKIISTDEIGDFIDENEDEVDTVLTNPYQKTNKQKSPNERCREFKTYTIQKGDTIWTIARKHKLTIDSLISLNKITSVHKIPAGKNLNIPYQNGLYYRIKKYDTIEKISKRYKISLPEINKYNDLTTYLPVGQVLFLNNTKYTKKERSLLFGNFFSVPVFGKLSSKYGIRMHPILNKRLFHTGIDIAAPTGTPIIASSDGKITFSGKKGGYGKLVKIKHGQGYETYYAHMNAIAVKNGQRVKKGQKIGTVGNTGRSTGSHLHFEIRHHNKYINPLRFVTY